MATRTITTRLAIDGEAAYKSAITQINSLLKAQESALKLVQSAYAGNANSLEALQAKSKVLADVQATQANKVKELSAAYQNAQSAVKTYEQRKAELTSKIQENEKALEQLKQTEGDTTEEQQKLTAETAKLKTELADNEAKLQAAERGTNNWETSLNKAQIELNETNAAIDKNDQYLDEAKVSTDGCATSIDRFGKEAKDAGNDAEQFGNKSKESVDTLAAAITSAGIVEGLKKIAQGFKECAEASIEFESAVTGIAKTTDLTGPELDAMAQSMKDLSREIPQTAADLALITENAGQLGIQKENLVDFTHVMADLGVATNLTGEEAAQTFAKFANITQMPQQDFERLGSTIVELGNNLATTEADIAAMSLRLAAAGTQAGMSQADIVSLAGALSSVGLEAEAGGSAFSKAINKITIAVETGSKDLDDFAQIAGMSASDFAQAWRTDAAGALVSFTEGLGDVEAHGKSATVLLDELGFTEVRLSDALKRASSSGDLFRQSLERGNAAWTENTALAREAELRYGTTESKLQLLENAFTNVKIAIGDQLNPAISAFTETATEILEWVEKFIQDNEQVVPVITAVAAALGVLALAVVGYTVVKKAVIPVIKAFNAALSANPIGLVITAIAALTAAVAAYTATAFKASEETQLIANGAKSLAATMEESAKAYSDTAYSIDAQASTAQGLIDKLEALRAKSNLTKSEQIQMSSIVDKLNTMYPEMSAELQFVTDAYGNVRGAINQTSDAMRDSIDVMRLRAEEEAKTARIAELTNQEADAKTRLAEIEAERAEILDGATPKQREAIEALLETGDAAKYLNVGLLTADETTKEAYESLLELKEGEEELTEQLDDATEKLKTYKAEMDAKSEATDVAALSTLQLEDRYAALIAKYGELAVSKEEYMAMAEGMTEAEVAEIDNTLALGEQYDALIEKYGTLSVSREEYIAATEGMTEAQKAEYDSALELQGAEEALAQKYTETYESAYESLEGQFALWEKVEAGATKSAQDIIAAITSQEEYYSSYTENLDSLLNRNVAGVEHLAAKFSDGSTDSAAALAGLASASDEEIAKIIEGMQRTDDAMDGTATKIAEAEVKGGESFTALGDKAQEYTDKFIEEMSRTDDGQEKYSKNLSKMKTDTDTTASSIEKRISDMVAAMNKSSEAAAAAQNTANGFLNVLSSKVDEFRAKGAALGQAVIDGYNNAQKIASPSKVAMQSAEYTAQGYEIVLDKKVKELAALGEKMGTAVNQGYVDSIKESLEKSAAIAYESPITNNYGGNRQAVVNLTINTKELSKEQTEFVIYQARKQIGRMMS